MTIVVSPLGVIDASPAQVYLQTIHPQSRRTVEDALLRILRALWPERTWTRRQAVQAPWHRITPEHVAKARARLVELKRAPSTIQHAEYVLRAVLKTAWVNGLISDDIIRRIRAMPRVQGSRPLAGRELTLSERTSLYGTCDLATPKGARNAALLALLDGMALRRAECVSLDVRDYDQGRGTLRVHRKGNKQHLLPVPRMQRDLLRCWLDVRAKTLPEDSGPLIVGVSRRGEVQGSTLSTDAILRILSRMARTAKIEHCSPHDLRRTYAGDQLDAGVDLVLVSKLMGHASTRTTERYDRRGARRLAEAAEVRSLPIRKAEKSE